MSLQPIANKFRLLFGLDVVLAESFREHRIARELGRGDELRERLLLDGIHVAEKVEELFLRCA